MKRGRYFFDQYFPFSNVMSGSSGVQTGVDQKGLFSTSFCALATISGWWPQITELMFCLCPSLWNRTKAEGCHRNFTRISSEVAPPVFFSHYPLTLKTSHGIVGAKSWNGFLESTTSLQTSELCGLGTEPVSDSLNQPDREKCLNKLLQEWQEGVLGCPWQNSLKSLWWFYWSLFSLKNNKL